MSFECPWCSYETENPRELVQHLTMAEKSHEVLAAGQLEQAEREVERRWRMN